MGIAFFMRCQPLLLEIPHYQPSFGCVLALKWLSTKIYIKKAQEHGRKVCVSGLPDSSQRMCYWWKVFIGVDDSCGSIGTRNEDFVYISTSQRTAR
ncbi:Hypothetical predicted protein [Paramuricea clavata]|uniref:Uncharacterized protein n=1 Tax=Paramuricea clavata TaxID=317549 RepID=A0A6S7JTW2_PARCT|nr:Hypothetical predicted protein [Paramuricea clavata]